MGDLLRGCRTLLAEKDAEIARLRAERKSIRDLEAAALILLSEIDSATDMDCVIAASSSLRAALASHAPAEGEAKEPVTWAALLEQMAESTFVSERPAATLREIAEHLQYRHPPAQEPRT